MSDRLQARLDAVYAIGGGPGANRIGYSPEEDEAHRLAAGWMAELGLAVDVDPDGNLVGRRAGEDPGLAEVWAGSHLDSVPEGGRFDGPLGVLAALEAVSRLGRRRRTLGVAVFRDEERGCRGSRAFVARGRLPGAFVEVHHEQGTRLTTRDAPLGIVTGITGYKRVERVVEGRPGHAGTTPMEGREDALVRAAEEILRVRDVALSIPGTVATVGRIEAEPGAANVIPGSVRFTIDARAPDADRLSRLLDALGIDPSEAQAPVAFAGASVEALRHAVVSRGLPAVELDSGAGHDAGVLALAGVDAAMLFVRAGGEGVSHSPDEACSEDDVVLAVDVLTDALAALADAPGATPR
jgi:acetylornithine deacetylase/succinyl-diaminopimelate desuccinylase-like protein